MTPHRLEPTSLSLVVIARNEEDNLPHLLASVGGVVREIIIIDTGSDDMAASEQMADDAGARWLYYPWHDNFAAARNFGLDHATSDWILSLDADERLLPDAIPVIEAVTSQPPPAFPIGYCFGFLNYDKAGKFIGEDATAPRLFPRSPEMRWHGRIHEEVHAEGKETRLVRLPGVQFSHHGYDLATLPQKLERNIRILRLELEEHPDDPKALYYMALSCRDTYRTDEAVYWAKRALEVGQAPIWQRELEEFLGIAGEEKPASGTLIVLTVDHFQRAGGQFSHKMKLMANGTIAQDTHELAKVLRAKADQLEPPTPQHPDLPGDVERADTRSLKGKD